MWLLDACNYPAVYELYTAVWVEVLSLTSPPCMSFILQCELRCYHWPALRVWALYCSVSWGVITDQPSVYELYTALWVEVLSLTSPPCMRFILQCELRCYHWPALRVWALYCSVSWGVITDQPSVYELYTAVWVEVLSLTSPPCMSFILQCELRCYHWPALRVWALYCIVSWGVITDQPSVYELYTAVWIEVLSLTSPPCMSFILHCELRCYHWPALRVWDLYCSVSWGVITDQPSVYELYTAVWVEVLSLTSPPCMSFILQCELRCYHWPALRVWALYCSVSWGVITDQPSVYELYTALWVEVLSLTSPPCMSFILQCELRCYHWPALRVWALYCSVSWGVITDQPSVQITTVGIIRVGYYIRNNRYCTAIHWNRHCHQLF